MKHTDLQQLINHYQKLQVPVGCSATELRKARNKKLSELITPAVEVADSPEVWEVIDKETHNIQKAYHQLMEYQKNEGDIEFFNEVVSKFITLGLPLDATLTDVRKARNTLLAQLRLSYYPVSKNAQNQEHTIHQIQSAYCYLMHHKKKIQDEFNLLIQE